MEKVIVTGANGFVGSAVCNELTSRGIYVTAVVRRNTQSIANIVNLPHIEIMHCNLDEYYKLPQIITDREYDTMYHFAWEGSAGSLRGDESVQIKNIQYACDLTRICKELQVKRIVFASSIMEYEIATMMGTDSVPGINTLYCTAKLAADYMVRAVAGDSGIEYIRGVISNIYGPGENSPRFVNTSLRKMLNGEHCAFSAGNQLYDFIYVSDAAEAFVAIGEKGISNRTYYIGSLNPRPLKEFILEMKDCVDPNMEIGLGEMPYNGVSLTYKEFDVDAVKNDTGFIPKVSFKEGINKTIAWIKEN